MTIIPDEPPMIEQILGTPEGFLKWVLVILMGKAGWNAIDRIIPTRGRRGGGTTIIQETGPGDVQETD